MVLKHILHFDDNAYRKALHDTNDYPDEKLAQQDIRKTRQAVAAVCAIGTGVGGAFLTSGATLVVAGLGARRLSVAERKLELIHAELKLRHLKIHKATKRDVLIPLVTCSVGTAIGAGIDIGVRDLLHTAASAGTSMLRAPVPTSTGGTLHAILADPEGVAVGMQYGLVTGFAEVHHAVLASGHGDMMCAAVVAHSNRALLVDPSSSLGVGEHLGEAASLSMEKTIGSYACSNVVGLGLTATL